MPKGTDVGIETWEKRLKAAGDLYEKWEKDFRVKECYNYYVGEQLAEPFDRFGQRRAQVNKIHPEVRNNIPALYFYRPFARLVASPEETDDPGTEIEASTQLLQDTANHLVRDPEVCFRESTFLGLKEAHWAFACVEVGYSADFTDAAYAKKPPLKEKEDTKLPPPIKEEGGGEYGSAPAPPQTSSEEVPPGFHQMPDGSTMADSEMGGGEQAGGESLDDLQKQIDELKAQLRGEKFYVKHIPAKQVLVSESDMPILGHNDWVGYWEDLPLEDVKESPAYENTRDLKAATDGTEEEEKKYSDASGCPDKIRLFKLWDLRAKERIVMAKGHKKFLLRKKFKRCPLKFLRFDIDPYHFYPRPLILSKLGPQDEYNDSREYLRKVRKGTVPRYTYDEDAVLATEMQKLESGEMGTYVPRKSGTVDPIQPINQPSFSENAIQTLTLSDKEFNDVGGVGGDARIAQTKTATQAKIAEVKEQAQDSFDRLVVADWLASIVDELLRLAVDNMNIDQWVAVNVAPDSVYAPQTIEQVKANVAKVNAEILGDASAGVHWTVQIDMESLSPVAEEEKFQKWMQALSLFANPPMARLFSVSPALLKHTLNLLGIKSAKDQSEIIGAMQQVVQMEQMLAAQSQNAAPGVSPQPGGSEPGMPSGGPQPGGPVGPGASVPKMGGG